MQTIYLQQGNNAQTAGPARVAQTISSKMGSSVPGSVSVQGYSSHSAMNKQAPSVQVGYTNKSNDMAGGPPPLTMQSKPAAGSLQVGNAVNEHEGISLRASTGVGPPAFSQQDGISLRGELSQLSSRVGETLSELGSEVATLKAEMVKSFARHKAQSESIDTNLNVEIEARLEMARTLDSDLRDLIKLEVEQVHEMVVREMRERMDGHKVIREEGQLQQQALASFTGRLDEAIMELRTEVPRLAQENAAMKMQFTQLCEAQAGHAGQTEALAKSLADEIQERRIALENLSRDLRQDIEDETHSMNKRVAEFSATLEKVQAELSNDLQQQLVELRRSVNELGVCVNTSQNTMKSAQERIALNRDDLTEARSDILRLEKCIKEASDRMSQQTGELDSKLKVQDVALRSSIGSAIEGSQSGLKDWVDSTVGNRVGSLERGLRTEMNERSTAVLQITGKVSHNAERWCQLQAKYEDILLEVQRTSPRF